MSDMWMPAQTTVPPGARALSAAGTRASRPDAKMIAPSSSAPGGASSLPPAHVGAELARERLGAFVARAA